MINPDGFINERIETLYACDEYKMFLLTGQTNGADGGRRAYISVKSYHTLDDESCAEMKKAATPWEEKDSRIRITPNQGMLSLYDGVTGTTSSVPWSELDPGIQAKLRGGGTDPFAKYAGNPAKIIRDIPINRPLALKRNPSP